MLVLLLSTVWCVGGYSQEKPEVTLDFTSNSWKLPTKAGKANDAGTYTSGNYSIIIGGNLSQNGCFYSSTNKSVIIGKSGATLSLPKFDFDVEKIVLVKRVSGTVSARVTQNIFVGNVAVSTQTTGANNDNTYIIKDGYTSAGNIYTLKVTNAYNTQFSKIEIYKKASTKTFKSLAISGSPTKTKYNDGEAFDPTGLVVTGTYDDNTTATITDGITWKSTPETLAVGNTSCSVTATVNGVTSPAYPVTGLTVVKSIKPIVFDFTGNWDGISPTAVKNNRTDFGQVVAGKELKVDGVVMTATNKTNSSNVTYLTGLYGTTENHLLRVYGSITFTAPDGYNISEVKFTGSDLKNFLTTDKAYIESTWSGNAHAIKFNTSNSVQVKTATIKLVAATPVTPEVTSGTIKFIAQDTDGGYYATFSSDKDVVFTNDVVVSGVSITGGKLSLNNLNRADCYVTDAKVGYEAGIVEKGYYVPGNTGVLVYSTDATALYYFPKTTQAVTLPANQLKPAPAKGGEFTREDGYKYYKLAYDNYTAKTGLGFYWGEKTGGAFNVKAGTAYLAVPTSESNAKGFAFDGETTGIENVNVAANQSKTIYNLNGQRVSNMSQAGLYIVNGKKVVIRK